MLMTASRTVPTIVNPTIRPRTISLDRTGLVTTVWIVRLRMSAGRLKALRNRASSSTRYVVAVITKLK